MFTERAEQVRSKVAELVKQANQKFNIDLPEIQIRFDLRGGAAGMAGGRFGQFYMRFNRDMMLNQGWDHLINDTVPHELAHIVCFVNPRLGRNHDLGWKRVCRALGGTGKRCHSEEVVYANGRTYYYTTTQGHVIAISQQRHGKIQRGKSYTLRGKGAINRQCQYSTSKPTETVQIKKVIAAPVAGPVATVDSTSSKADQVRAKIRECRSVGQDQEVVVQWAQLVLQMNRTLARVYVRNNWNKV